MQRMLFRQGYATLFRQAHPTAHAGMGLKAFRAERHLIVSRAAPYGQVNQSMERAGWTWPSISACRIFGGAVHRQHDEPAGHRARKLAASAAPPFGLRFLTPPLKVPALQTNMYWQRRYDRDGGNLWLRGLIVDAFAVGR